MIRCHCYPNPNDPRQGTGCGGCPAAQDRRERRRRAVSVLKAVSLILAVASSGCAFQRAQVFDSTGQMRAEHVCANVVRITDCAMETTEDDGLKSGQRSYAMSGEFGSTLVTGGAIAGYYFGGPAGAAGGAAAGKAADQALKGIGKALSSEPTE